MKTRRLTPLVLAAALVVSTLVSGMLTAPVQAQDGPFGTAFSLVVKRLGFKATREVDVDVQVDGRDAVVDITFDKPVKQCLGVKRVAFQVKVLEDDKKIDHLTIEIPDGATHVQFPVEFPGPGNYTLAMNEKDVIMKPAKVRLHPDATVSVDVTVPESVALACESGDTRAGC